ncbi:hypothetical protein PM8797T_30866 [Gimesia maris DSM 8797]|nr:hypothetical protein PM8797T_30866 [Gimesia maris DSM 8797]
MKLLSGNKITETKSGNFVSVFWLHSEPGS